jgi:hypothetical protein
MKTFFAEITNFEELMDIITRNKNKDKKHAIKNIDIAGDKEQDDIQLEVSGSESTRAPLVASASEELDPDIIDMSYTKPRHVPNRGEGASSWDSDT